MQADDEAPFDKSANTTVVSSNCKPPRSVAGSSKSSKDAIAAGSNDGKPPAKAEPARSVAPAFDQGPRSAAPATYKEPRKTVPTPSEKFVIDEMKQTAEKVVEEPPKPTPTLPLCLNKLRTNHQMLATPAQPVKAEDPRILMSDLKVRLLPEGRAQFTAACLSGDPNAKILFVAEFIPEIQEYLNTIEEAIASFVSKQTVTSYKPSKNEVVLASYEDRYYRAVCRSSTKINEKRHYSVHFIDYGDVTQVTEENLRPFDKTLKYEIVTHSVKFLNMPTNEEELAKLVESGFVQVKDVKESDEDGVSYTANFVL